MDPFNSLDWIDCTTIGQRSKGLKVEVSIMTPGKYRHAKVNWEGYREGEWIDGWPEDEDADDK